MNYYDEPSPLRRFARWGVLIAGLGVALAGMILPWPSYFEKRAQRVEFEKQNAEFERQRQAIVDKYGASKLGRIGPSREMNAVIVAETAFHARTVPAVNAAIERHSRLQRISLLMIGGGLSVAVLGWYLTIHRPPDWLPQDIERIGDRVNERLRQ